MERPNRTGTEPRAGGLPIPTSGSVNGFGGLLLLMPNPWRSGVLAIVVLGIGLPGCADCAPPIKWYSVTGRGKPTGSPVHPQYFGIA